MRDSYYDVALICLNGHVVNNSYNTMPAHNTKYCEDCGAETINKCQHCGESIRGEYHVSGVFAPSMYTAPSYCINCGKPFQWFAEKLKALDEVIDLTEELNELEKAELKERARELTAENPRTNIAALKVKKFLMKVGSETGTVVKDILVQIAVETAKQYIGLG